jgi:hypothetical protein
LPPEFAAFAVVHPAAEANPATDNPFKKSLLFMYSPKRAQVKINFLPLYHTSAQKSASVSVQLPSLLRSTVS